MSVVSVLLSAQKRKAIALLLVAIVSQKSEAFFAASCESLGQSAHAACVQGNVSNVALGQEINRIVQACYAADAGGVATAVNVVGAAGAAGVGGGKTNAPGVQSGANAGTVTNTGTGAASTGCQMTGSFSFPSQACSTAIGKLVQKCSSYGVDAANAASGIGSTAAAGGSLMDKMGPALIGAGLGALAGYMMGGDDDGSSSSASEAIPPSLPPVAENPPTESSSSSTASNPSNSSSSSSGIDVPAVVTMPTVDPKKEIGDGDSGIKVAVNDNIVTDDDDDSSDSSSSDDSSGGTTTIGGSAGGTTGEVADGGEDGSGRDVSDVNTQNDDTVIGLVGGQRTGASINFGGEGSATDSASGSGGSNMVLGTPGRTNRGLAGSSSSKSSQRSSSSNSSSSSLMRTSSIVGDDNSRGLSGTTSTRTREQIREDLRKRGLIK